MSKDTDEEENIGAYKSTSGSLQSMVLIFLGFLLFISFIVFSYYFLAYSFKFLNNIDFFSNQTNRNIDSIRNELKFYTFKDNNYTKNTNIINNETAIYTKYLEAKYNNSNTPVPKNIIIPHDFTHFCGDINNKSPTSVTKSKLEILEQCYVLKYSDQLRNSSYIMINHTAVERIRDIIKAAVDSVNNMSDINNHSKTFFSDSEVINVTKIAKLQQNTSKLYSSIKNNFTLNFSYLGLDNWPYKQILNVVPHDLQNKKISLQTGVSQYEDKLQKSNFPLIGVVPFVNIKGAFLSFPILIAIGFSFVSLQFKKLMTIRKKLRLEEEKVKSVFTWIDILQPLPEKAFPFTIIALPFILFVITIIFIYFLWYQHVPYIDNATLLSSDILSIPQNVKYLLSYLYLLAALLMAFSYYQILLGWKNYRTVKSNVVSSSSLKSSPLFKNYKGYSA